MLVATKLNRDLILDQVTVAVVSEPCQRFGGSLGREMCVNELSDGNKATDCQAQF